MLQPAYSIRNVKVKPPSTQTLQAVRDTLHLFQDELKADPIQDVQSIKMCDDSITILSRIIRRAVLEDPTWDERHVAVG